MVEKRAVALFATLAILVLRERFAAGCIVETFQFTTPPTLGNTPESQHEWMSYYDNTHKAISIAMNVFAVMSRIYVTNKENIKAYKPEDIPENLLWCLELYHLQLCIERERETKLNEAIHKRPNDLKYRTEVAADFIVLLIVKSVAYYIAVMFSGNNPFQLELTKQKARIALYLISFAGTIPTGKIIEEIRMLINPIFGTTAKVTLATMEVYINAVEQSVGGYRNEAILMNTMHNDTYHYIGDPRAIHADSLNILLGAFANILYDFKTEVYTKEVVFNARVNTQYAVMHDIPRYYQLLFNRPSGSSLINFFQEIESLFASKRGLYMPGIKDSNIITINRGTYEQLEVVERDIKNAGDDQTHKALVLHRQAKYNEASTSTLVGI